MAQNPYEDMYAGLVMPDMSSIAMGDQTPAASPIPTMTPDRGAAEAGGVLGRVSQVPANGGFDLTKFYQQTLGRAPDANEMASDSQNIAKYGADAFASDFTKRLDTRTPEQKGYVPQAPVANVAGSPANSMFGKINSYLDQILQNQGNFNMGLVKQKRENVKDMIDTARMKQQQNLKTNLASRGLATLPGQASGVEASGLRGLETDLGTAYSGALRDIFANEEQLASQRFMDALGLGASSARDQANYDLGDRRLGLDALNSERNYGLDVDRLGLQRMTSQGDLALRQGEQELASRLGLGRLDLDSQIAATNARNTSASSIQELINAILNASRNSSEGYY